MWVDGEPGVDGPFDDVDSARQHVSASVGQEFWLLVALDQIEAAILTEVDDGVVSDVAVGDTRHRDACGGELLAVRVHLRLEVGGGYRQRRVAVNRLFDERFAVDG